MQHRAKDIEEKEEARRHKKARPTFEQRKETGVPEDNRTGPAQTVLGLQQTYGNRYVQRVMSGVQAKLVVNPPDDQYEREADRVADAVTKASASSVRRKESELEEEPIQAKPEDYTRLQRQVEEEEEEEEEEPIEAKSSESQPNIVSKDLEAGINTARGSGQPLADSVRNSLEPQLGHDFGQVHIHTDAGADKLSRQLGAEAFTTGNDVFFRDGAYQPGSDSGRGLIAHELTHVVQQGAARVSRQAAEIEETAATDPKEKAKSELKKAVGKVASGPKKEDIKELLHWAAKCQLLGLDAEAKEAIDEAAEKASTSLKSKIAVLDVKSAKKEMVKELLDAAADVMKLGGDDKAVESALKKALDWAEGRLASAMIRLKASPTEANAKDVAARAAQLQLLGGDSTKAAEAVMKWEEEAGKEGKPGKAR